MLALFGWMDLLIIIKWLTVWSDDEASEKSISKSPSIITVLINMFLGGGKVNPDTEAYLFISNDVQQTVSVILVLVFLLMVPIMLLVKPLHIRSQMKKKSGNRSVHGFSELHEELDEEENQLLTKEGN